MLVVQGWGLETLRPRSMDDRCVDSSSMSEGLGVFVFEHDSVGG